MKRAILLFALLFLPISLPAQENSCLRRVLPVSIVERNEVPVSGLTAENFRGEFRGAPVRIVSATWDSNPKRIVLLVDVSGSMSLANKNLVAGLLFENILKSAPDGTLFALITFADEVFVQSGLSQHRQALSNLTRKVYLGNHKPLRGRTKLWDAVGEAVKILEPSQPGDAIFTVTDGGDSASQKKAADVEMLLQKSGLRFFASIVSISPETIAHSYEELVGLRALRNLAGNTGGRVFDLEDLPRSGFAYDLDSSERQKFIFETADKILIQIHGFYFVEIELMSEVEKPSPWSLKLIAKDGALKKTRLYYPRTLLPCSSPAKNRP